MTAAAKAKDVFGDFLPPPPASIMLTFGSKSVADFILNWCVTASLVRVRVQTWLGWVVAKHDQAAGR